MNKIILGKTGIVIEKQGFGCLPIQRISQQDAVYLLHKAYDGGINFFDTARAYSDSEQKVEQHFQICVTTLFWQQRPEQKRQRNSGKTWKQVFAL